MNAITPQIIRRWQNESLSHGYRDTYLKTIDTHLLSVFRYGAKYYDLPNPYNKADHIGSSTARSMQFWTLQEYRTFIAQYRDQPMIFIAFELLYWCGLRVGEMLALTPADIDEKKHLLKITKTYARHNRQDIISTPKTANSVRNVAMPDFLFAEVMDYIRTSELKKNDRLVPHCSDFLKYHLQCGCKKSGIRQIHITKSYTQVDGKEIISTPKTKKSIRDVGIPQFLLDEINLYIRCHCPDPDRRLFERPRHYLFFKLKKGCELSGAKPIRTHDLRHSHVSLLINAGFSALDIAERVGHESVATTLDVYAHLFPDQQQILVDRLEELHNETETT